MNCAFGVRLKELNPHLICVLCGGYLINAMTIQECLHSFCRSCILRYLDSSPCCPICDVHVHRTRPHLNIKVRTFIKDIISHVVVTFEHPYSLIEDTIPLKLTREDKVLQDLVYKLVPGLYHRERLRRLEYVKTHPPDELELDSSDDDVPSDYSTEEDSANTHALQMNLDYPPAIQETENISLCLQLCDAGPPYTNSSCTSSPQADGRHVVDKRYLLCPAAMPLSSLHKFITNKFQLSTDHKIEMYFSEENLPPNCRLMDAAYLYHWKQMEPLKLFYTVTHPIKDTTMKDKSCKMTNLTNIHVKLSKPCSIDTTKDKQSSDTHEMDVNEGPIKPGLKQIEKRPKLKPCVLSPKECSKELVVSLEKCNSLDIIKHRNEESYGGTSISNVEESSTNRIENIDRDGNMLGSNLKSKLTEDLRSYKSMRESEANNSSQTSVLNQQMDKGMGSPKPNTVNSFPEEAPRNEAISKASQDELLSQIVIPTTSKESIDIGKEPENIKARNKVGPSNSSIELETSAKTAVSCSLLLPGNIRGYVQSAQQKQSMISVSSNSTDHDKLAVPGLLYSPDKHLPISVGSHVKQQNDTQGICEEGNQKLPIENYVENDDLSDKDKTCKSSGKTEIVMSDIMPENKEKVLTKENNDILKSLQTQADNTHNTEVNNTHAQGTQFPLPFYNVSNNPETTVQSQSLQTTTTNVSPKYSSQKSVEVQTDNFPQNNIGPLHINTDSIHGENVNSSKTAVQNRAMSSPRSPDSSTEPQGHSSRKRHSTSGFARKYRSPSKQSKSMQRSNSVNDQDNVKQKRHRMKSPYDPYSFSHHESQHDLKSSMRDFTQNSTDEESQKIVSDTKGDTRNALDFLQDYVRYVHENIDFEGLKNQASLKELAESISKGVKYPQKSGTETAKTQITKVSPSLIPLKHIASAHELLQHSFNKETNVQSITNKYQRKIPISTEYQHRHPISTDLARPTNDALALTPTVNKGQPIKEHTKAKDVDKDRPIQEYASISSTSCDKPREKKIPPLKLKLSPTTSNQPVKKKMKSTKGNQSPNDSGSPRIFLRISRANIPPFNKSLSADFSKKKSPNAYISTTSRVKRELSFDAQSAKKRKLDKSSESSKNNLGSELVRVYPGKSVNEATTNVSTKASNEIVNLTSTLQSPSDSGVLESNTNSKHSKPTSSIKNLDAGGVSPLNQLPNTSPSVIDTLYAYLPNHEQKVSVDEFAVNKRTSKLLALQNDLDASVPQSGLELLSRASEKFSPIPERAYPDPTEGCEASSNNINASRSNIAKVSTAHTALNSNLVTPNMHISGKDTGSRLYTCSECITPTASQRSLVNPRINTCNIDAFKLSNATVVTKHATLQSNIVKPTTDIESRASNVKAGGLSNAIVITTQNAISAYIANPIVNTKPNPSHAAIPATVSTTQNVAQNNLVKLTILRGPSTNASDSPNGSGSRKAIIDTTSNTAQGIQANLRHAMMPAMQKGPRALAFNAISNSAIRAAQNVSHSNWTNVRPIMIPALQNLPSTSNHLPRNSLQISEQMTKTLYDSLNKSKTGSTYMPSAPYGHESKPPLSSVLSSTSNTATSVTQSKIDGKHRNPFSTAVSTGTNQLAAPTKVSSLAMTNTSTKPLFSLNRSPSLQHYLHNLVPVTSVDIAQETTKMHSRPTLVSQQFAQTSSDNITNPTITNKYYSNHIKNRLLLASAVPKQVSIEPEISKMNTPMANSKNLEPRMQHLPVGNVISLNSANEGQTNLNDSDVIVASSINTRGENSNRINSVHTSRSLNHSFVTEKVGKANVTLTTTHAQIKGNSKAVNLPLTTTQETVVSKSIQNTDASTEHTRLSRNISSTNVSPSVTPTKLTEKAKTITPSSTAPHEAYTTRRIGNSDISTEHAAKMLANSAPMLTLGNIYMGGKHLIPPHVAYQGLIYPVSGIVMLDGRLPHALNQVAAMRNIAMQRNLQEDRNKSLVLSKVDPQVSNKSTSLLNVPKQAMGSSQSSIISAKTNTNSDLSSNKANQNNPGVVNMPQHPLQRLPYSSTSSFQSSSEFSHSHTSGNTICGGYRYQKGRSSDGRRNEISQPTKVEKQTSLPSNALLNNNNTLQRSDYNAMDLNMIKGLQYSHSTCPAATIESTTIAPSKMHVPTNSKDLEGKEEDLNETVLEMRAVCEPRKDTMSSLKNTPLALTTKKS